MSESDGRVRPSRPDRPDGSRWRAPIEAIGLTGLVLASAVTAPPGRVPLDRTGVLLLAVPAAAVALRRRWPVPVLALTTAALVGYLVRGYPGIAAALPVLPALFTAARTRRRWAAGAAVAAALVGGVAGGIAFPGGQPVPKDLVQWWLLMVGWLVAACVAGELARQRQAHLTSVEQRALDAERTREETARRRANEERLRIARELHDSLTHCISIINVQAGVAVHLARKRAEPVPEALVAIQEASREAMRELRSTLEVLRSEDGSTGAGLDRLDGLVEGARKAGLAVTVQISGERRRLPAPVDRAAYRIVQEALTNVTRHAGPATATVRLEYAAQAFAVQVDDDGLGCGGLPTEPGVGLIGMRERVAALGGSLHAGPREDTGFTVQATLPLAVPS